MSSNLLKLDLGFNRPKIFQLLEVAVLPDVCYTIVLKKVDRFPRNFLYIDICLARQLK